MLLVYSAPDVHGGSELSTRHIDLMGEIKEAINEQGEAWDLFRDTQAKNFAKLEKDNDALKKQQLEDRGRIEELESRGSSPGKTGAPGLRDLGHKVFHTPNGPLYALPYDVKMADVFRPEKKPEISFERWLPAALLGENCRDKEAVEYTRELKQLVTTTTGILIPQEYISDWIDRLRSQMVLNTAGMTTLVMDAKIVNMSALVSDAAATWHTESASISAGNPTFAARTLTAQTLVVRCQGSVELAQDSPNFGAQLAGVIARAMAVELDRVGLIGTGSAPQPRGILNTTGRNTVLSVGAFADYSKFLQGLKELLVDNVPLDVATRFAIMSPGAWNRAESLVTGIASDKTQLKRPAALQDTQFLVTSNGLETGSPLTTTIFMGQFADLLLGVRREASVEALKVTTYASNLLLEFVGYLRADYTLTRASSFVTLEGVTPL